MSPKLRNFYSVEFLNCEFIPYKILHLITSIYICESGSVFGIRIHKAPEYGSRSTTLA